MGFDSKMHQLMVLLKDAESGKIQLPDFQRGYKWEDERVRQLLTTILRGHPLGILMRLETGNESIRFKPRPIAGTEDTATSEPDYLLLDGQQRLTSLTQALTGDGVVHTKDSRGKLLVRRYFVNIEDLLGDDQFTDESVISVPEDGTIRTNFNREIVLDLRTNEAQIEAGYFPCNLLYSPIEAIQWFSGHPNPNLLAEFSTKVMHAAQSYQIPAIDLDRRTDKAAVATVFEKVNVGGLPLNVFELLTAVFAGDKSFYDQNGKDFRLNDDWLAIKQSWQGHDALGKVENTDFLQAITLLATFERSKQAIEGRKLGVSAKREDILQLDLENYLRWREPLTQAFIWSANFLADDHIFKAKDVPYPKQLVPLAALRVVLGEKADHYSVKNRIRQWYWAGVLGELYGSAIETRFVRDLEAVPAWAMQEEDAGTPRTIQDASFIESRLHSIRTRNSAAYKGIAALIMGHNSKDWIENKAFGSFHNRDMNVDIHHIFPKKWCELNSIDYERQESIINKTTLSARTNRVIGGHAPSKYLNKVSQESGLSDPAIDEVLSNHLINPELLRADKFDEFFEARRNQLCELIGEAMGKDVQRDVSQGKPLEDSSQFDPEALDDLTPEDAQE